MRSQCAGWMRKLLALPFSSSSMIQFPNFNDQSPNVNHTFKCIPVTLFLIVFFGLDFYSFVRATWNATLLKRYSISLSILYDINLDLPCLYFELCVENWISRMFRYHCLCHSGEVNVRHIKYLHRILHKTTFNVCKQNAHKIIALQMSPSTWNCWTCSLNCDLYKIYFSFDSKYKLQFMRSDRFLPQCYKFSPETFWHWVAVAWSWSHITRKWERNEDKGLHILLNYIIISFEWQDTFSNIESLNEIFLSHKQNMSRTKI